METIKEFLESSTIHGLVYISKSKRKVSRLVWIVLVVMAFSIAFKLISNSYMEWEEDPISTSVSTDTIAKLRFPNVTVCPPQGYNTALNFDLIQAAKIILTQKDRELLYKEACRVLQSLTTYTCRSMSC